MRIHMIAATLTLLGQPIAASAQTAPPAPPTAATPSAAAPQRSEMSPEAKARMEKFRAACGADLQTRCATVAKGADGSRGEMRQCVEINKAKFSASCQAAIAERDANREARKQAAPATVEKPKG
jgi:hypothetical protein